MKKDNYDTGKFLREIATAVVVVSAGVASLFYACNTFKNYFNNNWEYSPEYILVPKRSYPVILETASPDRETVSTNKLEEGL